MQENINKEKLLEFYLETLIEKPRIAIFRVFAEKHKHLAKNLEFDEKAVNGEILEFVEGKTIDMFLNN